MSDFTAGAVRLAGFAGAVLGWSPASFWLATPAELAAVVGAAAEGGAHSGGVAPPDAATIAAMQEACPDG